MSELRNKLPLAVEVVSGGDASVRSSGSVIPLSNIGNGTIALGTARRFRIQPNLRSTAESIIVLLGYTNPVTLENAEYALKDLQELRENVPAGTTLYFTLYDTALFGPGAGMFYDTLIVTKYE